MEEKERNSVQTKVLTFEEAMSNIVSTYRRNTYRDTWREGSITKCILDIVVALRNELNELKEELNVK